MGHELTSSGLRPSRLKIDAILDMEQPGDRPALMRLLGVAQYVAKFVPRFSEITTPLRGLLAKDSEFRWTDTHSKALHDLKQLLVSAPTLGYYDASSSGLGCVCMQDGRPIEYASRALTPTERDSYCQLEKELLAVCWALSRYHYYCYGTVSYTHLTLPTKRIV